MAISTATARRVNVAPVNRQALRRYGEFWRALQMVGQAVAEAERLAAQAVDLDAAAPVKANWAVPAAEELRTASKKAGRSLRVTSSAARKWEAELISREWRR
ncbi:MAG: hypothetical protein M3Z25_17580 [Actinomycetota bacterium]|nr:hypothetical protein [Actinomycetota bacterium]